MKDGRARPFKLLPTLQSEHTNTHRGHTNTHKINNYTKTRANVCENVVFLFGHGRGGWGQIKRYFQLRGHTFFMKI